MNKKQLAAMARSHGWQGDDARVPLAVIQQWCRDHGVAVDTASQPAQQPAAQPQPAAAPATQPQPVEVPAPASANVDGFEAMIERKIVAAIDAALSALPAAQPAPATTTTFDAATISAMVEAHLRALIPTAPQDAVILPDSVKDALAVTVTKPAGEIFKLAAQHGAHLPIVTLDGSHPNVPARDAHYIFDSRALHKLLVCEQKQPTHGHIWLAGPKGAGKTKFAEQYAARTGRPFFRINFEGAAEKYEIIGGEKLQAGTSVWLEGALVQALQVPHAVILLDEPSFCRAHNMACLHSVLEKNGRLTILETGRIITPAHGVTVIAADNTMGQGDATGNYEGVAPQNKALLDRFDHIVALTPPPPAIEARILHAETGLRREACKVIAEFSKRCRAHNQDGSLTDAVSMRQTLAFAAGLVHGIEARDCFESTIAHKAPPESIECLLQLFDAHLGDTLTQAMQGIVIDAQDQQPATQPTEGNQA